jgi:hypothetical protein
MLQSLREYDKSGFVVSCGEGTPEKKLIAEVGPRMVSLRDRIHKAVQGFF